MHATGRPLAFDAVLLIGSASSHAVAYRLIGLFLRSPSNSLNCLVASCIKFNALQLIRSTPSPGPGQSAARRGDRPQPIHQSAEDSLLPVMVAVADADSSCMAPDLGCQKQKPQAGRRQGGVLQ